MDLVDRAADITAVVPAVDLVDPDVGRADPAVDPVDPVDPVDLVADHLAVVAVAVGAKCSQLAAESICETIPQSHHG